MKQITPEELVNYFHYNKQGKLNEIFKDEEIEYFFQMSKNTPQIQSYLVEIPFKIKEDFILKIKNKKFLIKKEDYISKMELCNSMFRYSDKKPNFIFLIYKKDQSKFFDFIIFYFEDTKEYVVQIEKLTDNGKEKTLIKGKNNV